MNNFKDLKVWQKSIDLVKSVYSCTKDFPSEEKFGLIVQINRCVISVPSNIAEGSGRNSHKEFKYFLSVAKGSLNELQTQLIISEQLNYISSEKLIPLEAQIAEIGKMIAGLSKSLN